MGSNCAQAIDITHEQAHDNRDRVAYHNSTWHAMNTGHINNTKETSSTTTDFAVVCLFMCDINRPVPEKKRR